MATQTIDPVDLWHGNFNPVEQPSFTVYSQIDEDYDGNGAIPLAPNRRRIGFLPGLVTSDGDIGDDLG